MDIMGGMPRMRQLGILVSGEASNEDEEAIGR